MGFSSLEIDESDSEFKDRVYWLCTAPDAGGILLHHSMAMGEKWSEAVWINQSDPDNTFARTPVMAVNKEGIVCVAWVDRRNDTDRRKKDIYFAASLDGGQTFLPEVKVTDEASSPYTEYNGALADRWPTGGEYYGLAAKPDGSFQLMWPDSRSGVYQLYTTQIIVDK